MKRAFTLIELLVVIAIIAILAAILFPVFAQAKASAKSAASLSNVKQLALALHMYASDNDDMVVVVYPPDDPTITGNQYFQTNTWAGLVFPYVKSRPIFWDEIRSKNVSDRWTDTDDGQIYTWAWLMTFGINHDGYAATYAGTDCFNPYGSTSDSDARPRSMTSFADIAQRGAIMPTVWGGKTGVGWMRYLGWYAAWPYDNPQNYWSWWNEVWDATFVHPGKKLTTAFADGHAGKIGRDKFIPESWSYNQRCAVGDTYWNFWGKPWVSD